MSARTESDRPVAIVTGAASGIGAATAVALARVGYRVGIGTYSGDPHDPAHDTGRGPRRRW